MLCLLLVKCIDSQLYSLVFFNSRDKPECFEIDFFSH